MPDKLTIYEARWPERLTREETQALAIEKLKHRSAEEIAVDLRRLGHPVCAATVRRYTTGKHRAHKSLKEV